VAYKYGRPVDEDGSHNPSDKEKMFPNGML